MEYKDYYKILEVDKNADKKEIKRSYRRLAQKYHPDKNPDDKAAENKFKEINEAYEVLGDPENRSKYDQLGQSYHRYQQMGGGPGGFDFSQWAASGGPSGGYQRVNIDLNDLFGSSGSGSGSFSDFFSSIFGGGFQSQRRGQQDMFANQVSSKGQDMEHEVEITLEEAFHGTSRQLRRENGDNFTAKIPRGSKTGTKIRLRGKGVAGPSGTGDLYLVIRVSKHKQFQRSDNNLKTTVSIDVVTAVLGGKTNVPTMTGPVKLTVPEGTQGGKTFRLKGKGMPSLREKDKYGDLLVSVQIHVPEDLSDEERQLYEQLRQRSQA
jgi:curved DNA-binding protein